MTSFKLCKLEGHYDVTSKYLSVQTNLCKLFTTKSNNNKKNPTKLVHDKRH